MGLIQLFIGLIKKCTQCGKSVFRASISSDGLCKICEHVNVKVEKEKRREENELILEKKKEIIIKEEFKNKRIQETKLKEHNNQIENKYTLSPYNPKAEFEYILNSLPQYDICLGSEPCRNINCTESIKYKKVTSRANYKNLGNFVVVDLETTGFSPNKNKIIEVGAVKFIDFTPIESFNTYINPNVKISKKITELTGIDNSMVGGAPEFHQIIPSLVDFIDDFDIVGHCLSFDVRFLQANGMRFSQNDRNYYDTMYIAKDCLTTPPKRRDSVTGEYLIDYDNPYDVIDMKLHTLCTFYGIFRDIEHRAVSDCLATGMLFEILAEQITSKNLIYSSI